MGAKTRLLDLFGGVEKRFIVERFDPDISEASWAAVVLEEHWPGLGSELLRPDFLEVIGRSVSEWMVDGSGFFEAGFFLDKLAVEPSCDGAWFGDFSVGITAWGFVSNVVDLPFPGFARSVYERFREAIEGSFDMFVHFFFSEGVEDLHFVVSVDVDPAIAFGNIGNHEFDVDVGISEMPLRYDVIDVAGAFGSHEAICISGPIGSITFHTQKFQMVFVEQDDCAFWGTNGDFGLIWLEGLLCLLGCTDATGATEHCEE